MIRVFGAPALAVCLFVFANSAFGQTAETVKPPPNPLPREVAESLILESGVTGRTGAILFDLDSDTVLDSYAAEEAYPPASSIKIATVARALEVLGPNYSFPTQIWMTGEIVGNVLNGDLYLQGNGDPTLDTADLAGMLGELKELGVEVVNGNFYFDDFSLPRGSWIQAEQKDHVGSNPGYGALNLNFNRVWLDATGYEANDALRMYARSTGRTVEVFSIRVKLLKDAPAPILKHRFTAAGEVWEADSRTLSWARKRWLPVRDAGAYTAHVFSRLAEEEGIVLPVAQRRRVPVHAEVVVLHESAILARLSAELLFYSNNLMAEMFGLVTEANLGEHPAGTVEAARGLARWIDRAAPESDLALSGQSGLSDQSQITPMIFRGLLSRLAASRRRREDIRFFLAVYNVDLSLTGAGAWVHAKSGTLNFVRTLVGYMGELDSGQKLGFVIFSADLERRRLLLPLLDRPAKTVEQTEATEWQFHAINLEEEILVAWYRRFVEGF